MLETRLSLILGFDWIMAQCDKLRVTTSYSLELTRALEREEVMDFSEFGEILEQSSHVGLIHVGKWESRHLSTGKVRRIMQIIVGEDLKTLAETLLVQYRDFIEIFGKAAQASLLVHGPQDMVIDLEPEKQPPSGKLYPLYPDELELLKEYLDKILRTGKIRPSKSSAGAPIFFAKQANDKLYIVVDYRGLNPITIKDKYSLPLMTTLIEQVGTSQVFSKLDLKLGFNLLCIAEADQGKRAFKTRYGLYEYTVMPFGLTNALSVFQRHLNNILSEKIDHGVVLYIDDILIYTQTEEEHVELVCWVLKKFSENGLCVTIDKCIFYIPEVEFVEFQIGTQGVQMSQKNVKDILNWPAPRSVKEVEKFIGFANFYRQFIQGFSKLTLPIQTLTHHGVMWN